MTAACPVCSQQVRVTKYGALYRHGECAGGGRQLAAGGTFGPPGVGSRLLARGADNQASGTPPHAGQTAVYLVRPGRRNEELRYSLRSLARAGITRVVLVGYRPPWLTGVEHVRTDQPDRAAKSTNMRRGYEAIAAHGPAEFVLFNDDMFVMHDIFAIEPTHRGPLSDLLRKVRPTSYFKGLKAAAALLPADALAYDCHHTPMPMTRAALAEALAMYDGNHGLRTIVGNLLGLGGEKVPNAKNPPADHWPRRTYLSTNDKSFRYGPIGAFIRRRLPDPSPWETP